MIKYKMFPESVTKVAAQGQAISWAEPVVARRKRHHGSDCTMCPKRAESRQGAPIDKPKIYNAVSEDTRTMLVVVDVPDWTQSVYKLVKLIRTQGFGGVVVVDRVVKCGGGKVEDLKDNIVSACQPHLAFTYQVAKPDMVLLCGSRSAKAFLGHTVMVLKNPGSWQVITEGDKKVPVVCVPSTVDIALNYIYRREAKAAVRFLHHETWKELEHDWKGTVKVIEDENDLPAFQQWVDGCSWLAFDVETTGKLFTKEFNIITISFARANSKVAWVVHPLAMSNLEVHECVKDVLTNPLIGKVGQNVKYDIHSCSQYYGERPEGIIGDTRLMYKLVNAEGAADLESIAATIGIGAHKKEADDEIKKAAKQLRAKAKEAAGRTLKRHEYDAMSFAYGQIDYEILLRYCALDTFVTAKIFAHYEKVIDQHDFLGETFSRTVHPASRAFCDIERTGMVVDLSNVDVAKQYIKGEMDKVEERIRAHDIDPDKPATIRAFFDREGLKSPWVTEKTGLAATDAKALRKMRSQHTIISELLEWRKLSKLLSSYLESLPYYVRDDGRVHPSILLDGARSGRLSCIAGSNKLLTNFGWVRFDQLGSLTASHSVYTYTHERRWRRVLACWPTGVRDTVYVETENGKTIQCTPDHKLRSREGWVQAGDTLGVEIQVEEHEGLVPFRETEGRFSLLVGDVGRRRPEGVVEQLRGVSPRRPLAVDVLQEGDEVDGRTRGPRSDKKAILCKYQRVGQEVRRGYRSQEGDCNLLKEHRQQAGRVCEGPDRRSGGAANGKLRLECLATAQVYRVQRTGHTEQPEEARLKCRKVGIQAVEERDVRGFLGIRKADSGPVKTIAWRGVRHRDVLPTRVSYVDRPELPNVKAENSAEILRQGVLGQETSVLHVEEVRGRERGGKGVAGKRNTSCKMCEADRRGICVQNGGHHRRQQGGYRGRWIFSSCISCDGEGQTADGTVQKIRISSPESNRPHGREVHEGRGGPSAASDRYERVKLITPAGRVLVFDFTVEDDHSGLVENIQVENCTDPAMQTIPSHGGQEAKLVKNCFVVPKGYTLLQLDFKTLEVYVTAAWAEDRKMIDALLSGADFHTNTAALIGPYAWGMSSEEVLEEIKRDLSGPEGKSAKRNMAKRTTFGVLYGMGPESLAEEVHASVDMAKSMIKGFFRGYEDTARKMAWAQDFVKKTGYIEIPWDGAPSRIRPLPYVGYPDSKRQGGALRASTNSPIQGWAADFCTMSAVKLSHVLLHDFNNRARIVMTVHDSILIESEDSVATEVARTAAEIMTSWPCGPLKLQVDVEAGKAWGSLEKLKL